jgi:hypothetical protein
VPLPPVPKVVPPTVNVFDEEPSFVNKYVLEFNSIDETRENEKRVPLGPDTVESFSEVPILVTFGCVPNVKL